MKVCPHCGVENGDRVRYCHECDGYLGTIEAQAEQVTVEELVAKEEKRSRLKAWLIGCGFTLFFLIYNVWAIYMNFEVFGNLDKYFLLIPWYIPCLVVFFFPYDKVYGIIRKKRGKPEKHLSDFILMIFRAVAVIGLVQMYISTYDILAFRPDF